MLTGFMPSTYAIIVGLIALVFLSIKDIKTKEISFWVCAAVIILALLEPGKNLLHGLYGLLMGFLPLFILSLIGNGGAGDAIVMGTLGFLFGLRVIAYSIFVGYVLYFLVLSCLYIITKDKKKQLPFIPFATAGVILIIIIAMFDNGILA